MKKTIDLYTTQPARIEAFQQAPLYAKIAGYIDTVLVDIGDRVKQDQVLVRISVPELHNDLAEKQALVEQAKSEVQQAVAAGHAAGAALGTATALVAQAQASIQRTESDLRRWQSELARVSELARSGSVTAKLEDETRHQFDAAEAARQEALATVVSAQAVEQQREADVDKAAADVRAAEARLRVAEAALARAQTMLAYTEIKAPFDGVVTQRQIDSGHFVQPATGHAHPLLTVAQTDQVRVFVDVPELEAARVDSGEQADAATVKVQALDGRTFAGRVTRTSWSLDATNRCLLVEIDLPNDQGLLRPGMYAMTTIHLERREGALVIPATALVRRSSGDVACWFVEGGQLHCRNVVPGLRSGADQEVLSGVGPEDVIVLKNVDALKEGQRVELIVTE